MRALPKRAGFAGITIAVLLIVSLSAQLYVPARLQNQVLGGPTNVALVSGLSGPYNDAFDTVKGEAFVPNANANTVSVVSDANNSIVATIHVALNPVAAVYDYGKGEVFVSDHHSSLVSVISDASNTVIANVSVGSTPYGLAYDSAKGEIFVANTYENDGNGTVSVISDATNSVVATVTVGMRPFGAAYDSGMGEVFVTNEEGHSVSVISDSSNTVVHLIEIGSSTHLVGITYDLAKGELFVGEETTGNLYVISDASNTVVASIHLGTTLYWPVFDSGAQEVFVTSPDSNGTIYVVSDVNNTSVASVKVGHNPIGIAYDPDRGELFVTNFQSNTVSVISDTSQTTGKLSSPLPTSFSITLIAPTTNPARIAWSAQIAHSFRSAGIDVHLIYTTFPAMSARSFGCGVANCNKTYDQGGFDGVFVGFGGGTNLPDFGTQNVQYYLGGAPNYYAPIGANFNFFNNATFNTLAHQYNADYNATDRIIKAQQMVSIVAQQRPDLVIEYPTSAFVFANNVLPWGQKNSWTASSIGDFQHWKLLSGNSINVGMTGALNDINPLPTPSSNSLYDSYVYKSVFAGLQEYNPVTGIFFNALANKIVSSPDHLTWTESFRAHSFVDSAPVRSDDYVYTAMANVLIADNAVNAGSYGGLLGAYGHGFCNCSEQQFTFLNGTSDYVVGGTYYHGSAPGGFSATSIWTALNATAFRFTLTNPYLFTNPILTGLSALPMHILDGIPFGSWDASWFSTLHSSPTGYSWNAANFGGNGSFAYGFGPVGDGAYIYRGYDGVSSTAHFIKNAGYWNASGLAGLGEFNANSLSVSTIVSASGALSAFLGQSVNFLDSNYAFPGFELPAFNSLGGYIISQNDASAGWQDLPLLMSNPVWGTGTATPLGQAHPARAAYAARLVREAMSLLIPRQEIVQNILQGTGSPGITQFSPFFKFAYPPSVHADPFDRALALQLLAEAGYKTSSGTGLLRVQGSPAVWTTLYVDGKATNDWGVNWLEIASSNHTVNFTDVPGFKSPKMMNVTFYLFNGTRLGSVNVPRGGSVPVLTNATSVVTLTFIQSGFLRIITSPATDALVSINGTALEPWGLWVSLPPGEYSVSFQPVIGLSTPVTMLATVCPGATTLVTGYYNNGTTRVTPGC